MKFESISGSHGNDCSDDLEDSLSYSPLKDMTNKENSPSFVLSGLDRVRKSPSTTRLLALFGSQLKNDGPEPSPFDAKITPKRLQDFWDTPSKPGLDEASSSDNSNLLADLTAEVTALRSSLAAIQGDCEFHRQRAMTAHDQVDTLNKYIASLDEEKRKTQVPISGPLDEEKEKLIDEIASLESLNKSLARQNDQLRSRSSVTSRFQQKDVRIQTDAKEYISVGLDPALPHRVEPPPLPPRSEIHIDHLLNSPAIKVSRVLYIKDAEVQTDTPAWETGPFQAVISRDVSPVSNLVRLPIPTRAEAYNDDNQFLIVPIPPESVGSSSRRRGYPYRTEQRARRSLPTYTTYPGSPQGTKPYRRLSVPKPLLAAVPCAAVRDPSNSPTGWQKEWRALSSARRGKSMGSVARPRWVP